MINHISKLSQRYCYGFTLVELIIAISLMAIVSTVGLASYTKSLSSRADARRKADLEQIKGALEMYRSNSTNSSYPTALPTLAATPKYLTVPVDPRDGRAYGYSASSGGYYLGATLENIPVPTCAVATLTSCTNFNSGTIRCNYCIGPYGVE